MGIYVKGTPKEGEYKFIKTTDGFVLEGKDFAYACTEIDDEAIDIAQDIIDGCKELKERVDKGIVRCGECEHCEKRETAKHILINYCEAHGISVLDTDYCNWGERRADEHID